MIVRDPFQVMPTWTVLCQGNHVGHFGSVYHSYGANGVTAFEIPAIDAASARRIATAAGMTVTHVFE
jgi:hypothetical protein